MTNVIQDLAPDFFDSSLRSWNPLRSYYHSNRYAKIRKFISGRFRKGMRILDLGCGSASWNTAHLPVEGVDQNMEMLEYGKLKGYLSRAVVRNFKDMPLPFKEKSFDFIILAEVLEHLEEPDRMMAEVKRLLKEDGLVIITVPLDTFPSAWSILFGLECIILGDLLCNEYYRSRCGHIHHFSVGGMMGYLERNGFSVLEKEITIMNIGMLASRAVRRRA